MSYLIKGFDISRWETVNWDIVKQNNFDFGFAKSSEALFEDINWKSHNAGMKSVGIIDGAYHFYRPLVDPIKQANFFYSVAKGIRIPPVIDIEAWYAVDQDYYYNTSRSIVISNIKQILSTTQYLFNKTPMIYTSMGFWNQFIGDTDWAKNYPLWVANYGVIAPHLPIGWTKWVFWQYSESGIVPGINGETDMNYFFGSKDDLLTFIGETTPIPTPTPSVSIPKCKVIVNSLKIRTSPSTSATVSGYLYKDDTPYKLEEIQVGNDIWVNIGWKQYAAKLYSGYTYIVDL